MTIIVYLITSSTAVVIFVFFHKLCTCERWGVLRFAKMCFWSWPWWSPATTCSSAFQTFSVGEKAKRWCSSNVVFILWQMVIFFCSFVSPFALRFCLNASVPPPNHPPFHETTVNITLISTTAWASLAWRLLKQLCMHTPLFYDLTVQETSFLCARKHPLLLKMKRASDKVATSCMIEWSLSAF